MAVAAAADALGDAPVAREEVERLVVASTTPPVESEGIAPRVARALGLPADVRTTDRTQDAAAGVEALLAAFEADGPALAVASDAPLGDPAGSSVGDDVRAVIRRIYEQEGVTRYGVKFVPRIRPTADELLSRWHPSFRG